MGHIAFCLLDSFQPFSFAFFGPSSQLAFSAQEKGIYVPVEGIVLFIPSGIINVCHQFRCNCWGSGKTMDRCPKTMHLRVSNTSTRPCRAALTGLKPRRAKSTQPFFLVDIYIYRWGSKPYRDVHYGTFVSTHRHDSHYVCVAMSYNAPENGLIRPCWFFAAETWESDAWSMYSASPEPFQTTQRGFVQNILCAHKPSKFQL